VLIPSIDLMGGKIVQLVQGSRKELEFDDFEGWANRFANFPLVQLIDLDAAMGRDPNSKLIEFFVKRLPCQVGGGIRTMEAARTVLELGAQRVIFGSALILDDQINIAFAKQIASEIGEDKLVFGVDSKGGKVAIRGWREMTAISPLKMIQALDPFCSAFLYTHIDTEGLMTGLPLEAIRPLREATSKQLIVAGGIATSAEVEQLHTMGIDAVVGMALYSGRMSLPVSIPISK
jgi:phosphoribosylformimino-5-aminoimidazole carboxamide ribotide isomerase